MRAEVISIGTELLIGSILNTNARFLCQVLAENAIDVYHQVTVGDNPSRIKECLQKASERSDILITTGGLGPTEDDVTVNAVAAFLEQKLIFHKPTVTLISKKLRERGYKMTRLIERQCFVPEKAIILSNDKGTAPALFCQYFFKKEKKWLITLPGPPRELEPLFIKKALPLLLKKTAAHKETFIRRSLKIAGLMETQVAEKIPGLLRLKPPVTVGIYAKPGEVELKIMAKDPSSKKAKNLVARIEKIIRNRLGKTIYGSDEETLASVVGELLKRKNKTLAVAESCSGGFLSNEITHIPGSSDYFKGGVICYSNEIKTSLLGVNPQTLKEHGAVSVQTAKELAGGVNDRLGSDYAISITGIAGPGGATKSKPVGHVCIAIATPTKILSKAFQFFGSRQEIKASSTRKALNLLRLELLKK